MIEGAIAVRVSALKYGDNGANGGMCGRMLWGDSSPNFLEHVKSDNQATRPPSAAFDLLYCFRSVLRRYDSS